MSAETAETRTEALPTLPAAPKLELDRPSAKDLAELDARLRALSSSDESERDAAARELLEVDAHLVPAIAFRLDEVADRAEKEAMKRLFAELRKQSRELDRTENEETSRAGGPSPDYLALVVAHPRTQNKAYADLVSVVGMSRMLSQIGTVEAARTLISVYVRFGEFLRVHVQRELARLADRAVPALLEARRHPAEKIAHWATRQLDALGRGVPGEAVRVTDPQTLADVLRAYGHTRDPDATRIVVSFSNSERAVIREAARQAIALMGEVAMWQLKDTYESVVGKKPPRDWSWERTARELFAEFDRSRSAVVQKSFEAGRAARAKGDLEAMRRAFDEVVAHDPKFERRAELCSGYLDYAKQSFAQRPAEAEIALLRAERFSDTPGERARIQSQLLTLRAVESTKSGIADVVLLERAIDLDRGNERARTLLSELRQGKPENGGARTRQIAAGTIGLGALIAVLALLRRRREDVVPPDTATSASPKNAPVAPAAPDPGRTALSAPAGPAESNPASPSPAESNPASPSPAESSSVSAYIGPTSATTEPKSPTTETTSTAEPPRAAPDTKE